MQGLGGLTPPLAKDKTVILLWMAGGPSHIDTWTRSRTGRRRIAGRSASRRRSCPASSSASTCRSRRRCSTSSRSSARSMPAQQPRAEHGHADRRTCTPSRATNPEARSYPAIASLVAKHHGANHPAMPPYVAFMRSRSHLAFAGYLGKQLRSVPRQPGRAAAGLRPRRQRHRQALRRPDVRTSAGRDAGPHRRPPLAVAELRPASRRPRRVRLDGGPGPVRAAGGRNAHRRPRARRVRPARRSRSRRATGTASTSGASRRCWPGGWSRRGRRSSRST